MRCTLTALCTPMHIPTRVGAESSQTRGQKPGEGGSTSTSPPCRKPCLATPLWGIALINDSAHPSSIGCHILHSCWSPPAKAVEAFSKPSPRPVHTVSIRADARPQQQPLQASQLAVLISHLALLLLRPYASCDPFWKPLEGSSSLLTDLGGSPTSLGVFKRAARLREEKVQRSRQMSGNRRMTPHLIPHPSP
jgi:hypothetical protein